MVVFPAHLLILKYIYSNSDAIYILFYILYIIFFLLSYCYINVYRNIYIIFRYQCDCYSAVDGLRVFSFFCSLDLRAVS